MCCINVYYLDVKSVRYGNVTMWRFGLNSFVNFVKFSHATVVYFRFFVVTRNCLVLQCSLQEKQKM